MHVYRKDLTVRGSKFFLMQQYLSRIYQTCACISQFGEEKNNYLQNKHNSKDKKVIKVQQDTIIVRELVQLRRQLACFIQHLIGAGSFIAILDVLHALCNCKELLLDGILLQISWMREQTTGNRHWVKGKKNNRGNQAFQEKRKLLPIAKDHVADVCEYMWVSHESFFCWLARTTLELEELLGISRIGH